MKPEQVASIYNQIAQHCCGHSGNYSQRGFDEIEDPRRQVCGRVRAQYCSFEDDRQFTISKAIDRESLLAAPGLSLIKRNL
jgi:hypothetical protein